LIVNKIIVEIINVIKKFKFNSEINALLKIPDIAALISITVSVGI